VSRRHLRIDWDGKQATIVDLGSGNGTWLNNVRLTPHVPQPWTDDAELRVGPFWLSLDRTGAPGVSGDGRAAAGDLDFPYFNVVSSGTAEAAPTTPRLVALDDSGQPLQGIDL